MYVCVQSGNGVKLNPDDVRNHKCFCCIWNRFVEVDVVKKPSKNKENRQSVKTANEGSCGVQSELFSFVMFAASADLSHLTPSPRT